MTSKLALSSGFLAVAGLALLVVASQLAPAQSITPSELQPTLENKLVSVEGRLQAKWPSGDGWRLRVCSKGCVVVVVDGALSRMLEQRGRGVDAVTVGQRVGVVGWPRYTPAGWRFFPRSAESLQT